MSFPWLLLDGHVDSIDGVFGESLCKKTTIAIVDKDIMTAQKHK